VKSTPSLGLACVWQACPLNVSIPGMLGIVNSGPTGPTG
jgi:hypothetical protein